MYKQILVLMLTLAVIGVVSAQTMCPFDTSTQELATTYVEGATTYVEGKIVNAGMVSGFMSGSTSYLSGVTGNVTGYSSATKDVLSKAKELSFSNEFGFDSDTSSSQTAFIVSSGRTTYSESQAYDYCTPNLSCCEEYEPFCDRAVSSVSTTLSNGQFASEMSMSTLISTNMLTHTSAVDGSGSFSAAASYGMMQNSPYSFTKDTVFVSGQMKFAREVSFKSIKA